MKILFVLLLVATTSFTRGELEEEDPKTIWSFEDDASSSESDESPEASVLEGSYFDSDLLVLRDEDLRIKLNAAVDFVLDEARKAFTDDGQLTIPLKSVDKPFGHGILQGHFTASGGYFKNPASLKRTGDVALSKQGSSVSLQVALGLEVAEAGFDNYKLDILNFHDTGKIHAQITKNSLSMKVTLTYSPQCSFKLEYARFDELSGIKFDITGLGSFQKLFDELSKWLIDNFQNNLKTAVNEIMNKKLDQALEKSKICNLIPH